MNYVSSYLNDLETALSIPGIERLRGRTILITGASGLIGSCLCDVLLLLNKQHNYKMRLLFAGRSRERIAERFSPYCSDYHFVEYDATVPFSLDIPLDYIVHAASNAHPLAYANSPVETMLANIVGVDSLLKIAKNNLGSRLLYVSSSEVYGRKEGIASFSESDYSYVDILDPRACYPSSKRAAETLCISYVDEYGVDCVIVRPGHIYGPTMIGSDSRAHSEFARLAARGESIILKSKGDQIRSYCYVVDCVRALLTALLNGACGAAYNISNSNSIASVAELAEAFAAESGCKVEYREPSNAESKGYTKMPCSVVDSSKLQSIGWQGLFSLKDGVAHTLLALRNDNTMPNNSTSANNSASI